jgi:hypothetical protein
VSTPLLPARRWSILTPLPLWARIGLGVFTVSALLCYYQLRALGHLRAAWVSAHGSRDAAALDSLVCWDGVAPAERQRMRLLLAQELEHPIHTADIQLTFAADAQPGWRPNRFVVARLVVVYDTPERLTVSFPVGLSGLKSHQVVMMVPEK